MGKICNKCQKIKDLNMFHKQTSSKDGYMNRCKECRTIDSKEYQQRPDFKEKHKINVAKYRSKPETKEQKREYERLETVKEKRKVYENKPKVKERINKWHRDYIKEKYNNDNNYKLKEIIRSRIKRELKTDKKKHTIEYLDCDYNFARKWIEFRFEKDMTWENLGTVWQIDHILPISKFDFNNENEIKICFHWTNLQPLYSNINNSKTNKLELHYFFNNIVNVIRFNSKYKQFLGYQTVNESLQWLKKRDFRYGKNPTYVNTNNIVL
jgi:hypothetical protein